MTNQNETVQDIVSFLTAGGNNTIVEAMNYWRRGADENIEEAEGNWKMTGDWREEWANVPAALAQDLYLGHSFICNAHTDEEIREASVEDCQRYLELVGDDDGAVDGSTFGHNGEVYLSE